MANKKKNKKDVLYFTGGVIFTGAMIYFLPKIINSFSDYLYKSKDNEIQPLSDDWEPMIVKKTIFGGENE